MVFRQYKHSLWSIFHVVARVCDKQPTKNSTTSNNRYRCRQMKQRIQELCHTQWNLLAPSVHTLPIVPAEEMKGSYHEYHYHHQYNYYDHYWVQLTSWGSAGALARMTGKANAEMTTTAVRNKATSSRVFEEFMPSDSCRAINSNGTVSRYITTLMNGYHVLFRGWEGMSREIAKKKHIIRYFS